MGNRQIVTRRRFLGTVIGAGCGLLAIAGCSPAAPAPTAAPASAPTTVAAPAPTAAAPAPTTAPTAAAAPTAAPTTAPTAASGAAGKIGGNLNYLGFEGDDAPDVGKPFFEKNGITYGATYLNSSEELLTKLKAGGPGKYDVGTSNNRIVQPAIEQGFLEPLDLDRITHFKDLYSNFTSPEFVPWMYHEGKVYAIPAYFGFDVINYNADKVPSPPKDYNGLLDATYKGRIGILDNQGQLASVGLTLFNFSADQRTWTKDQLKQVVDWFKKLKANNKTFIKGYGEMADLLIRGDIWIGFIGWEYISVKGQKAGVNIKHFIADGPTSTWADAFVLFKGSSNRDTAYAWIDFMLSPETVAKTSEHVSSLVTNPKAVPMMPKDFADAMGFGNLESQLKRIHWKTNPNPTESDPNKITLGDVTKAWNEVKAS